MAKGIAKKSILVAIGLTAVLFAVNSSLAASEPALQELYKAAKEEGNVIWQYLGSVDLVEPLAKAFEAKYPGVKCTPFSFAGTGIHTRIITEAGAGKLSLDVATSFPYLFLQLVGRDLLTKYDWTKIGVPPNDILLDGVSVSIFDSPNIWVYNTKLVSKAEAPKTWNDVLDPKWKGSKISIRAAATPFAFLYPEWKKDKKKVEDSLEKLRKQEVVPGTRNSEVTSRIAGGECPIGTIPIEMALDLLKEGASVAVCPVSPTAASPIVVAIPKGVPHPNAAKLLIAWLHSREGREALRGKGLGPAAPCNASLMAQLLCDNGITYIPITSKEDLVEYDGAFSRMVVKTLGFMP